MVQKNETESKKKPEEKDNEPLEDVKEKLGYSADGLNQAEAKKRLDQYGYNELVEEKVNPLLKFASYFWGPIPWMIEVAVILSAIVKRWEDFGIITGLLVINAVVGFWEEHQAGNAIEALKANLALKARVRRDGKWQNIPARELVPGDLIRVRLGDIIPADARLLTDDPVKVDQSALTGESLPVDKGQGETLYSSSVLSKGENDALVVATGENTFFGKTAQMVSETHTTSHFQRAVLKIGDYLIVIALALVILILGVSIFRGEQFVTTLQFALILTVAAIPVAMPAVLSITMAVGSQKLAKKQAIVSRLAAIEELSGMDVLCSDKTGTLTQNKLSVGDPFCLPGVTEEDLLVNAALASREEDQDPIDLAIIHGVPDPDQLKNFQVSRFQPFDPVSKRTEALLKTNKDDEIRVSKGAAQVILALLDEPEKVREQVENQVNGFASHGFRSLAVAKKDGNQSWQMLGVIPLYDPPREDSKETLATAHRMGVEVKMITGDQLAIAKEIASELDLGTNILAADQIEETKPHETAQMGEIIENSDGFAQVFPEHKYHIVDTLQQHGHIVGMTGDGVNDAPALKKADAGIAVSGATDAARAAADIVLLSPGISVIIDAIQEARKIFQRMSSYATYRITETIRVLVFMTLSILVFNFYPVTAIMIVLLAVLNDGAIISIAYDNVKISEKPEAWNMRRVLGVATVLGLLGTVATFGLFFLGERVFHLDRAFIQTLTYLKLSVAGHLTIFVTRTAGPFWKIKPSKQLFFAILGTQTLATIFAAVGILMTPIGWKWAGLVWVYALMWFVVNDVAKQAVYRIMDSKTKPFLWVKHD